MKLPVGDVVIVGSGAAGVSAAMPLVEAGLHVVMIDAGLESEQALPAASFYDTRRHDPEQWKLFVGEQFQALRTDVPASPKFRAPSNAFAYEGYQQAYAIHTSNFALVGSLAAGGLSNVWGAGVSCYTPADLRDFPITRADLEPSYQTIAARIGLSGSRTDALAPFFGSDIPLQPPTALGENARRLWRRYTARPRPAQRYGVTIGRARNAVLTEDLGDRQGCNTTNTCIWGCARRSIYTALYDLAWLKRHDNFHYGGKLIVEALRPQPDAYRLRIRPVDSAAVFEYPAKVVLLACGAIGTAKLVLEALGVVDQEITFLSSPSMGFALWLPERLGAAVAREAFGLSQLSYTVQSDEEDAYAFGNLFGTDGLLMAEFLRYLPLSRPAAIRLMRLLSPALLLGNCFLPGKFSQHSLSCRSDGTLCLRGGYRPTLLAVVADIKRRLTRLWRRYGMVVLPHSFRLTDPGEDVHYAATVPMRYRPALHQAQPSGEVAGLAGVYVVDGAALSALPAKGHTLTIMANADRIARGLAARLQAAGNGSH